MLKVIKERSKFLIFGFITVMLFSTTLFGEVDASSGQRVFFHITEEEKQELQEMIREIQEMTEEIIRAVEDGALQEAETVTVITPPVVVQEDYSVGYIAYGANNDKEEVKKLQRFLNKYEGENLLVTGLYNELTFEAVKRFQEKYATEILHPWGITEATGLVYKTTQSKIDSIMAGERAIATEQPGQVVTEEDDLVEEDQLWGIPSEEKLEEDYEEFEEKKSNLLEWILVIIGTLGIIVIIYNIRDFKDPANTLV